MKKCLVTLLSFFLVNLVLIPTANAAIANPSPVCVADTCTINFETTDDFYLWSAPTTGTFTFQVWGAQGGSALATDGTVVGAGPLGGYAAGNYSLTSGQAIYIYVGGQGSGSTGSSDTIIGGFNGGGTGFNGSSPGRAASGGGASDIRISGNSLSNRVIVAGGGGGGKFYTGYGTQGGGFGGGTSGVTGTSSAPSGWTLPSSTNGAGGTQFGGGSGGSNGGVAGSGTAGQGGRGVLNPGTYGASGGGGGYYGGGGAGIGASPGGGSGYVGGVSSATNTAGNASMPNPDGGNMVGRSGNGYIRITYTPDTTAPTYSSSAVSSNGTQVVLTYNEALSATTAATSAFTVTAGGVSKTISSVTVSGSTVILNLSSAIRASQIVTFTYSDPTAGDDANAIQDLVGNDAASLTSQSVTNNSTVKATQTNITITSSTSVSFGSDLSLTSTGGSTGGTFTYTVISGSCTIEGSTLTPTSSGTCVIRSSLAENDNYLAAQSADTTITIATSNVSASITLDAGTLIYRQVKVITATATVAGKVTFKVNGKRLPGCIKKSVSTPNSYIATCSYRPSTRGYIKISVTLNPTNNSYIGTTTTSERLFVGNRSGTR